MAVIPRRNGTERLCKIWGWWWWGAGGVKKVNKEVVQVAYNPSKQVKKFLFLLAMENCK